MTIEAAANNALYKGYLLCCLCPYNTSMGFFLYLCTRNFRHKMTTPAPSFQFNSPAVAAAKALAILLMVMLHGGSPDNTSHYVSMFHMPLFFIMSGYCFKAKYLNDGRTFVMKRVKGVWWPYVKWMLVFLALHNVFFYLNIYNDVYGYRYRGWYDDVSHLFTWQEWGMKSLRTLNFSSDERLLGGYWFLKELFWASLIGYAVLWIAYNWHKAPWCRWHAKCGTPAMTSPAVSMLTIVIIGGGYFNTSLPLCLSRGGLSYPRPWH